MPERPARSVIVVTRNEAARIGRCLDALRWADELVMVNDDSTDATTEIARGHGARPAVLAGLWPLVLRPAGIFARKFVGQRGWREGWAGFVLCAFAALGVFATVVRLGELTGWLRTGAR